MVPTFRTQGFLFKWISVISQEPVLSCDHSQKDCQSHLADVCILSPKEPGSLQHVCEHAHTLGFCRVRVQLAPPST